MSRFVPFTVVAAAALALILAPAGTTASDESPVQLPLEGETEESEPASLSKDQVGPAETGACVPHPPIRINDNHGPEGFTWTNAVTGEREHRPGSGVVAGNGTPTSPFVISSWCVTSINVDDTTAHAVIRNNVVPGGGVSSSEGVGLREVSNVTVAGNVVSGHRVGVEIQSDTFQGPAKPVRNVSILDNTLASNDQQGLEVDVDQAPLDNLTIDGNLVEDNGEDGIFVEHRLAESSARVGITNNTIRGNGGGLDVRRVDLHLADNLVANNTGFGAVVFRSPIPTVSSNTFQNDGLVALGDDVDHYRLDLGAPNTVDGEPLRYVADASDVDIPRPAGQVIAVNATNVTVTGHTVTGPQWGVYAGRSQRVEVADIHGTVFAVESHDVTVRDSRLDRVSAWETSNATFQNNTVRPTRFPGVIERPGIFLHDANTAHIEGNDVGGSPAAGVGIEGMAANATVANNTIHDSETAGIHVEDHTGAQIENNTVRANDEGIFLDDEIDKAHLEANRIEDNRIGVRVGDELYGARQNVILADNAVQGNTEAGLNITEFTGALDARDNWWGAENGPSGGVEDACIGTVADGDGDAIETVEADVCFNPWLTEPNPDAGARR